MPAVCDSEPFNFSLKENIMRFNKLSAILALTALAILSGCAEFPSRAQEECIITEMSGSGNCPAWIHQ